MNVSLLMRAIALVSALLVLGAGVFVYMFLNDKEVVPVVEDVVVVDVPVEEESNHKVIGSSVEGRDIEVYTYGTGDIRLLLVGGMHGGYEWNSVLLAYDFIDYLEENPSFVPENITVSIIPSLNPDGVVAVIGTEERFALAEALAVGGDQSIGRFNANNVDLNRNFDCKWAPESSWRGKTVSAGTEAFSEPEAQALRSYVETYQPRSVVFWHSQANTVYASECEEGIIPETLDIMNTYANAAGYNTVAKFDAYPVTGDAEGWLASIGIPAITVELKTHETIEWSQNLAGVNALFRYYDESTMSQ